MKKTRHNIVKLMPYSLLHFLIKEKALKAYLDNVMCDRKTDILYYYTNSIRGHFLIIAAFTWHKTPEGRRYWQRLYNRFQIK